MKKVIVASTLALAFSAGAYAEEKNKGGLFVEPMITYEKGEGEIDYPSPVNSSSNKINGFGVGTRLGFHVYESIFIGVDGRYSMPNFKDSSLNQDVKAKSYNYGPVIGFQTPTDIGLRVWGGYVMGGELDPEKDKNVDAKFKDAKGYRVGAGIKLGIASLNLEYQDLKYGTTEIEEAGVFTPGSNYNDVNLKNKSFILSVSFPIAILKKIHCTHFVMASSVRINHRRTPYFYFINLPIDILNFYIFSTDLSPFTRFENAQF